MEHLTVPIPSHEKTLRSQFPPTSPLNVTEAPGLSFARYPTSDWFHNASPQADYLTDTLGFGRSQIVDLLIGTDTPTDFLRLPKEDAMALLHMHPDTEDRYDDLCAFLRQLYPEHI